MPREPDFDKSADMRLVELQRAGIGVQTPARSWESIITLEGSEVNAEGEQHLASAVLAVDATATPPSGLIPGAVVTVALSVVNEGAAPARNVRITVPLPGGGAYRNGSFVRDGKPQLDDAADELFETGVSIPEIAAGARVTFLWKIGVRIGNKPLVIAPIVSADETAVVGARSLLLSRAQAAGIGYVPPEPVRELPIYELDREEIIEQEATQAALSEYRPPMEPPIAPSAPPPDQPEPIPPPDQPAPVPEPGVPVPEPTIPGPPEEPPAIEPAAQQATAREAVLLYGRLDRPSISYFERIFSGSNRPTLLNHFILGGALACTRTQGQSDVANLKAHMEAQSQLLQRVVLHERMGRKEPIAEYAGTMLAQLDRLAPSPVTAPEPDPSGSMVLQVELEPPSLAVLRNMLEEQARWDFTKARQLTLALQARSVIAAAPSDRIAAAEAALRTYAQTSAMQLQRFFVRMRIDRTTGLLWMHDDALDTAARALIAALTALFE